MKIAALLITCNRRQLLCKLIEDFISQSRKPDAIFVIDNGSEDDTVEFVKTHFPHVRLIEIQHNTGHMGGLEVGVKSALEQGYDAVLSVDDDARLRNDTVEQLLNTIETYEGLRNAVIWCTNVSADGRFFTEPTCVKVDNEWKVYYEFTPELYGKVYETTGAANIGLYIPLSIIEHVGLPRSELAFCGEQEFNYRVQKAGFKLYRCFSSIIHHKRFEFHEVKLMGRTRYVCHSSPWRIYYEIRGIVYIDRVHKRRTLLKSLLNVAIISAVKIRYCDNKISGTVNVLRAIYDGMFGRMGMRVHIPRPKNVKPLVP